VSKEDVELISFEENSIIITVFIDDETALAEVKDVWENKVKGCQPPLLGSHKNGFSVFIPWILNPPADEKQESDS